LREVKARKTPFTSSDVGGVLIYQAEVCERTRSQAMRSGWSDHRITRNKYRPSGVCLLGKVRRVMPAWMEILINVIGYAGFIAIATYHKSPNEKFPDR
jgi:hypothetical protein